MDWLKMPPLASLRAFSAFAEKAGNVVQAGAALNVSHAAISQQLRALEKHMGVALLDRSGKSLTLTPDGRETGPRPASWIWRHRRQPLPI